MRNLYLTIVCLLFTISGYANRIDELKTDKEVADFIVSLDTAKFLARHSPKLYIPSDDSLWSKDKLVAANKVKNWQKVDFNHDGRTDLLAMAQWYHISTFVVTDIGNDRFKLIWLYYSGENEFAKIIDNKAGQLLAYFKNQQFLPQGKNSFIYAQDSTIIDTLIYRFDTFIEYNANPKAKQVSSMIVSGRENFSASFKSNGKLKFKGHDSSYRNYNITKKIDKSLLQPFYEVVNYMDFDKVKDEYQVFGYDYQTVDLVIKFKDGSVKKIHDYGIQSTFGLRKIYSLFHLLSKSQLPKQLSE